MHGKYLKKYQEGGVTVVGATLAVNHSSFQALQRISEWKKRFKTHDNDLIHIHTVDDIMKAFNQNRLGIIFHFQNS